MWKCYLLEFAYPEYSFYSSYQHIKDHKLIFIGNENWLGGSDGKASACKQEICNGTAIQLSIQSMGFQRVRRDWVTNTFTWTNRDMTKRWPEWKGKKHVGWDLLNKQLCPSWWQIGNVQPDICSRERAIGDAQQECAKKAAAVTERTLNQNRNQETFISCQNSVLVCYFDCDNLLGNFSTSLFFFKRKVYPIVTRSSTIRRNLLSLGTFYTLKVFLCRIHLSWLFLFIVLPWEGNIFVRANNKVIIITNASRIKV